MDRLFDLVVIGAGPAGLSAVIYACRAGLSVALIEKNAPGGKLLKTNKVENYPGYEEISGYELATNMYKHAKRYNYEYFYGDVIKVDENNGVVTIKTSNQEIKAKTTIIATGLEENKLNVKHEEKFYGKGISYCAVCDGYFFKDKSVAVIGGGNSALDESIYLSKIVDKIYLILRRDIFRGDQALVDIIRNSDNVEIIFNSTVKELIGEDTLEGIKIIDKQGNEQVLKIDGLFPYIGYAPNTKFAKELGILDKQGYIITDNNMRTKSKNIFAVGDVRSKKLRQIITASNDGAIAAIEVENYLNKK